MADSISVVVVEDHEATLKGLVAELASTGEIEIVGSARCAEEGLQLTRLRLPSVVLLDLHLPDSTGPKSLTQSFCELDSKIVILSGDARIAIIQLVLEMGVVGYVLKSEPIATVAEAVRSVAAGNTPFISPPNLIADNNPRITNAEQHLLKLLARGMKYNEIAALRVTSPETVRKQIDSLSAKLSLQSREQLIAWAVDSGYGKLELE